MNEENQSEGHLTLNEFVKKSLAPQWLAVLLTLIYASGFLCEFTFLDRFGIHDTGDEFLRSKYIHAGILFLLFPISIVIPLVLKMSLKNAELKKSKCTSFSVGDIKDLRNFVSKLINKSDPVSIFLSGMLDKNGLEALEKCQRPHTIPKNLEEILLENINRVIASGSIYDETRFASVNLRPETKKLLNKIRSGNGTDRRIMRFNRLILEDAYPKVLEVCSFKFPLYTLASFFNISAVFYFFLFTPHNFIFAKGLWIALLMVVSFVGPICINAFVNYLIVPRFQKWLIFILRWSLLVFVILGMDIWIFLGFFQPLGSIFWGDHRIPDGAIYYVVFVGLVPYVMWRSNQHSKKIQNQRSKAEIRLVGVSLSLMFCFLAVVSFAIRVYPCIPVARGGGNYTESPLVMLSFRPVLGTLPIVNSNTIALSTSNSFIIIERTSASLFLANINDEGGPAAWVKMRHLPHIIEVRRDSVDQIFYTQVSDTNLYPNPH
jgi:hypothetical protein